MGWSYRMRQWKERCSALHLQETTLRGRGFCAAAAQHVQLAQAELREARVPREVGLHLLGLPLRALVHYGYQALHPLERRMRACCSQASGLLQRRSTKNIYRPQKLLALIKIMSPLSR